MRYEVKVAGRMYAGNDPRILLKRAVKAWRTSSRRQNHYASVRELPESSSEEVGLTH